MNPRPPCTDCGETDPSKFRDGRSRGRTYQRKVCHSCFKARHRKTDKAWRDRHKAKAPPTPPAPPPPRAVDTIIQESRWSHERKRLRAENKALAEELKQMRDRFGLMEEVTTPVEPAVFVPRFGDRRQATAVVMLSDWHVEEPVYPDKVNGSNEYNLEIADQRIARLRDGVEWMLKMCEEHMDIQELIVWFGGDLFSGYIHEELVEENLLSPVESILWLKRRMIGILDSFAEIESLRSIRAPCNFGNHGRTTKKRRIGTGAENSYEWMLYMDLAMTYERDEKITVIPTRSPMSYVDVHGYTLRFVHGDEIGYQGGIGGLTIPLNKKIFRWNTQRHADVTCLGHFHTYQSMPHFVANGSLIGYNTFAQKLGFEYEPPMQAFFLMDARHGKALSTPIWCDPGQGPGEE